MAPLAIDRGEGVYLYGVDGTQYFDFNSIAMCVNIGHGDPRVGAAVAEQMDQRLVHVAVHGLGGPGSRRRDAGPGHARRA